MTMRVGLLLIGTALAVSACSFNGLPKDAYMGRGNPESLLTTSSERTNFSISDASSLTSLAKWIKSDKPTRAELTCSDTSAQLCAQTSDLLKAAGVATKTAKGNSDQVVLEYERVVARPCDNSFVSNQTNPYNLNHPAFGCSTAMNSVQMVGDYKQFTQPSISGLQDAEMAVKNVRKYEGIDDPYYPY